MKKYIKIFGLFLAVSTTSVTIAQAQTVYHHYHHHHHHHITSRGKGAIIGGVGGAVAGGIIGHGVGGALIGGAIGAGGGYVIGDAKDRKRERAHEAYLRERARRHPKSVTTTTTVRTAHY